jgi:sterol desaturase/sphingolipid hydroxylase (fatty acid hydroxylase superfamily)
MTSLLPVPPRTAAFRAEYRADVLPPRYSGAAHVALVLAVAGGGIAAALAFAAAHGARWSDAWIVPLTVLVANAVEYLAHRGPMHHRTRVLPALHTRHSGRHHRFFVADAMPFESLRDFHAVLFPPVLLLFFGAIACGLGALVALVAPAGVAALFVATALGYYLLYEVLHVLYHVPAHWRVGRLPGVRWLARLHQLHHEPQRMQRANFNLVFPLCDRLAGTLDTGAAAAPAEATLDSTGATR